MGCGDRALLRLGRLVECKQDEARGYSVGGRENGFRGAVVPPLAFHRYRDEGVRSLLLDKPIEGGVHIVDEGLEEVRGRQM